jgi:hypothetical protein
MPSNWATIRSADEDEEEEERRWMPVISAPDPEEGLARARP